MTRLNLVIATAALCVALLSAHTDHAYACDPAPDHTVDLLADTTPECATVATAFTYGAGELSIVNDCEDVFSLVATECDGCGESVDVAIGMTGRFIVESRSIGDGLREGEITEQSLEWTLGTASGTLMSQVTYYDNSDACDDFNNVDDGGGCAVGGGARGTVEFAVVTLLALVAWRRRRQ